MVSVSSIEVTDDPSPLANVQYFVMKCNQVLGTTIKVPDSKQVINVEWLCQAVGLVYPVIHPAGQGLKQPHNYHSQILSPRLGVGSKYAASKALVDDVLGYMVQFRHVCTCDIECSTSPCGACPQNDYCGNCNCVGPCECACQCQCECSEVRNGNDLVCPCNCEVLKGNCVWQCACKCNCNCECPCECACYCDCEAPCVGETCDPPGSGIPKTACTTERGSDGRIINVSYCNSGGYVTCSGNPPRSYYVSENCGTNNCASANNPPGQGDVNNVSYNPGLTMLDGVIKTVPGNNNQGLNVPDNRSPTCTVNSNCNCSSECACGASNCSTACGSGVTNTGGIQRNCLSFCPVINCDSE